MGRIYGKRAQAGLPVLFIRNSDSFQSVQRLAKAGLSADSVWEIERCKGVILDYLTQEKEYGAENLSSPTSLYMRHIQYSVYGTDPDADDQHRRVITESDSVSRRIL